VGPAAKLLPPNATAAGLIQVDGFVYAVTSNGCGGVAEAVWAMDWSREEKPVVSWSSNGAPVAGPALGVDGTVYVATGDGMSAYANSVVALEGKTLQVKDWFTMPGVRFTASPTIFTEGNSTYVAATGSDGRIYVLAADALGGASHNTPLLSAPAPAAKGDLNALAAWRDSGGTRWLLAPTQGSSETGAITAFKFAPLSTGPVLEQAWVSRNLIAPGPPIVVNGVVFALSGGNRSVPAVLYALNPDTGKEIWNSGNTITSFATGGLSAGTGQVYVVTYDNTVWAFGIPQAY
jgi:outer membrane protein assembly factor BamB